MLFSLAITSTAPFSVTVRSSLWVIPVMPFSLNFDLQIAMASKMEQTSCK